MEKKQFVVDYEFSEPRFGTVELSADNQEEAESLALQNLKQTYPEVEDFEITMISEVTEQDNA